jgi:glycosyl transferase family 87
MLKVFPFVLVGYLACRRQWRALAWTAVGVALIGLVTLWRVGNVAWSFTEAIPFLTNRFWLSDPDNISINAVVSRIFWPQGDLPLRPAADAARRVVIALAELGVFLVTVRATVRRESEPERRWQAFSLWMVAMIVLSPTAFPKYLIMLVVPFAALARTATPRGMPARAARAAIASYGLAFSHQPLMLFERVFDLSSTTMVDRVAKEYWVVVVLLAYLACYWNVTADDAPVPAAQR